MTAIDTQSAETAKGKTARATKQELKAGDKTPSGVVTQAKRTGRPSSYTDEIADTLCLRISEGESMRKICASQGMPNRRTVERWMEANKAFAAKCARAREDQAELMDEMILDVANASTPETAQCDRVKISAYQWRAAKLKPKVYGDQPQTQVSITNQTAIVCSEEQRARMLALREKLLEGGKQS